MVTQKNVEPTSLDEANKNNVNSTDAEQFSNLKNESAFITSFDILINFKKMQKNLYLSMAGEYWLDCITSIQLFPLKFRNVKEEEKYQNLLQIQFAQKTNLSVIYLVIVSIGVWIVGTSAFLNHWVNNIDSIIRYTFIMPFSLSLISLSLFLCAKTFNYKAYHLEFLFYILVCLYTTPYMLWCLFSMNTISLRYHWTQIDTMDPYKILEMYKYFAEVKMLIDSIFNAIFSSVIVVMTIFLNTRSRYNIYIHLTLGVILIVGKLIQISRLPRIMKVNNYIDGFYALLLLLCTWIARWFRELQERCALVRLRASDARVAAIRDKVMNRKQDVSVAETVLNNLEAVLTVLKKRNEARLTTAISNTLPEVIQLLEDSCNDIKRGDRKISYAKADSKIESNEDKEDIFINMYTINYNSIYSAKNKNTKTVESIAEVNDVNDWKSTESILIGGVNIPTPKLVVFLTPLVGQDMTLRLSEYWKTNKNILIEIGMILLTPFIEKLRTTEQLLLSFLYALQKNVWDSNPFHNSLFAAETAHLAMVFFNQLNLADRSEWTVTLAYILAALSICLGHTGRSPTFFVTTNSTVSLMRNDLAVFEGFQCFTLLSLIIVCPETNIFANLNFQEFMSIKKTLSSLTLNTDMVQHFEILSRLRVRKTSSEFSYNDSNDQILVLTILLKAAQIGYVGFEWPFCLDWCLRLQEEMYSQGEEEKALGLSINPLGNRSDHNLFVKRQIGFIQYIIIPLVEELCLFQKDNMILLQFHQRVLMNKQKWEAFESSKTTPEITKELQTDIANNKFSLFVLTRILSSNTFESIVTEPTTKDFLNL